MSSPILYVLIAVIFVWLVLISYLYWRVVNHYNTLVHGTRNKNLQEIMEELLKGQEFAKKDIAILKQQCATIEKDGLSHITKIGLLRFNPFKDTGGDQSFILALLNSNDTGILISGLYSRSGTRWYAKKVVNGKGAEHELSEDEKKALKEAKIVKS